VTVLFGGDCQYVILALISCLEIIRIIVIKKLNHSFQKGFKKIAYPGKVRESPCPFSSTPGTGNIREDSLALRSVGEVDK